MFDWKRFFPKRHSVIGIDVGSSSLKLADIKDSHQGPQLVKFAQLALPRGVIANGELLQPDVLSARLEELVSTAGCRRRPVVTCLSANSVMVKKVNFNLMGEEELRELLRDEGAKYLPFEDIEHVYLDFQILKGSDVNPNQMEVLIVAAKKDIVDLYTAAFHKTGLDVLIMDVDTYALETMYEENYEFEEEDVVALIDIGASATSVNVVKGGASIFTRNFSLGGNVITESFERTQGISFEEAEKLKREETAAKDKLNIDMLFHADPILQEIESTLDYVKFQSREYVKQIILSGGSASIPGLAEAIAARLHVEAEIANPFKKIAIDAKSVNLEEVVKSAPGLAVVVGLALRRVGDR